MLPGMNRHLGTGRAVALAVISALIVVLAPAAPPALAATPLTVTRAISQQNGSTQTVRGYVVGQPTATNTVVKSSFPSDYALAIADSASQSSTSQMLYVQIPSAYRSAWGLKTNPGLMGKQIDVTGALASYFSHPGMTGTSAFAFSGGGTEPPPPGGTSPWDSTYYAPAIGKSGTALRTSLHDIIDAHTKLSYDRVWTALKDTDQGPEQHGERHRALHRPLDLEEQQRRQPRSVEP
ncbi:DUF6359 domain-containing protein [Nocardioides sp. B-3]|uniref:DUF6359 domain-containing protein n=1 Tax=Nocardioides sp. B-3 TaxID=2895565 RepID=UPI0021527F95|nr:DUF6359 domain-containing protein [Nocardioides sp. B-3]UUZ60534.1 DUF6359 domain-containing protein [Nocardioides sp. B-3]